MYQTRRSYTNNNNLNNNNSKFTSNNTTKEKGNKSDGPTKPLPILHYTNEITTSVKNYPVTIIQGETGCGKSSVVPQIVLDNCTSSLKRKEPFVVVMQPRRIAAVELAKYVNKQRGGGVGHAVGHDLDSDTNCPLLFVTAGWLLKKIAHSPSFFSHISHIVMDEIHERTVEVDLLFFVVKQLFWQQLAPNCEMRLILMSATLNALSIGNYFTFLGYPVADPILIVDRLFPVDIFYLDNLFECNTVNLRDIPLQPRLIAAKINNAVEKPESAPISMMIELAVYICREIALEHSTDADGVCVLVFLPGILDIENMIDSLIEILEGTREKRFIEVLVLHSLLEKEEQAKVFESIAPCTTRLILTTNIAESSITLPQLRYVIDLGLNKHLSRSASQSTLCLQEYWISNASSRQRAGRVGRLFPGTVFRIYSQSFHAQLPQFDLPEILRTSLDSTILLLLTLHKTKSGIFSSPSESLAKLLSPPHPDNIKQAYTSLCEAGCIVCSPPNKNEEEKGKGKGKEKNAEAPSANADGVALTALGEFLQHLPFDVTIGKMIAIGAIFHKYLPHTIVMATAASLPEVFVRPNSFQGDVKFIKNIGHNQQCRIHFDNGAFSNMIAVVKLYRDYMGLNKEQQKNWCFTNCIHFARMKVLVTTIHQVAHKVAHGCPQFAELLAPLCRGEDPLLLRDKDTKILRLILVHSFSHNLLIETIRKTPGPGDDFLQIKFVPTKVMTHFFQTNVNSLFGALNPLTIEETDRPTKARFNTDLPQSYFSVTMQFKPARPTHPVLTYPPFGKHHFMKCFKRNNFNIHPQLYDIENKSSSSSISDVFTLTNPNTSYRSQWQLIDGSTVEILPNSPFTTLQLSPEITEKSLTVYGVTPAHTLTGTTGTVLVENLTLFVPSQPNDPFVSFLLALSVKSLARDVNLDVKRAHVAGVRIAERNVELSPKLPVQVLPLLRAIHDYIQAGLHNFNSRTTSELEDIRILTSALFSLTTVAECESFDFDLKLTNFHRISATAEALLEKSSEPANFQIFMPEDRDESWGPIKLPPESTENTWLAKTEKTPQKIPENTPQKFHEKTPQNFQTKTPHKTSGIPGKTQPQKVQENYQKREEYQKQEAKKPSANIDYFQLQFSSVLNLSSNTEHKSQQQPKFSNKYPPRYRAPPKTKDSSWRNLEYSEEERAFGNIKKIRKQDMMDDRW